MKKQKASNNNYKLVLGKGLKSISLPSSKRVKERAQPVKMVISPQVLVRKLKATTGSKELIKKIPELGNYAAWAPVATFSVCQKTGTARYLDFWDVDHFDGFTDMQRNLSECRVWFSANGFSSWGSQQTKTGRINCYFRAPYAGNYVCNVQLQSYGGLATVECLIDNFSFGPLHFNGSINQPHPTALSAGYHHFRIRQVSGSFFFISLTVWRVG